MTSANGNLNELEYDLLTELFNLGVSRAAVSLSEMLKQEIKLTVPEIDFCTRKDLILEFKHNTNIISISQNISGAVDMKSMLLFPSEGSNEVIRTMLGDHLSDEMATELQQEAFTEIGNIILNACIGIIAKALGEKFNIDLPLFDKDNAENVFLKNISNENEIIMSMKVDLILTSSKITGHIAFILGSVSLDNLKSHLQNMLGNI